MSPGPAVGEKIRSLAATPADGDRLIDHLQKVKLVISLGMRDDFLLTGERSIDRRARPVGGDAPLRARPELAAVARFRRQADRLVAYSSKKMNHISARPRRASTICCKWQRTSCRTAGPREASRRPCQGRGRDGLDLKSMIPRSARRRRSVSSRTAAWKTSPTTGAASGNGLPPSRSTCSITSAATLILAVVGGSKVSSEATTARQVGRIPIATLTTTAFRR